MSICSSNPNTPPKTLPTIGFLCASKELDVSITYAKVLYATKAIFPCKLIVFGNATTQALYAQAEHIDELVDIDIDGMQVAQKSRAAKKTYKPLRKAQIARINTYHCDYLILSDNRSAFITFALSTNAKKILCARKFVSLFAYRAKTLSIYTGNYYRTLPFEEILLHFLRMLHPKTYDKIYPTIDFSRAAIRAPQAIQRAVDRIYAYKIKPHLLESKLILVNPFNVTCKHTLPQNAWLDLIESLLDRAYKVEEMLQQATHNFTQIQ